MDSSLDIEILDLGLKVSIEDWQWDWGLSLGNWIEDWDWRLGLRIGDLGLGIDMEGLGL